VAAFDRQLKEIADVFASLQTDRTLDNAVGVQLDKAGEIVVLSRPEAGLLCGNEIYFDVIDDERYRKYLKYKAYKNSNDCTYYDIIKALQILWDVPKISYSEDENFPATIILTAPILSPQGAPAKISHIPDIKPAGVSVLYMYKIRVVITVQSELSFAKYEHPLCGTLLCGTYPVITTIGKYLTSAISVDCEIEFLTNEYALCGTLACKDEPAISTKGYSLKTEFSVDSSITPITTEYFLCNTKKCGIYF
jgi:hypothetical protein